MELLEPCRRTMEGTLSGGLKHDLWCIFGGLDIDILYNGFLGWVFSINEYEYILYIYIYLYYMYI